MAKVVISKTTPKARVIYFDKIAHIDLRGSEVEAIEDYERENYLVNINMVWWLTFQYNDKTKKFYLDHSDEQKMGEQLEEHAKIEKDWWDISWLYKQYIDRQECILVTKEWDLAQQIDEMISMLHL